MAFIKKYKKYLRTAALIWTACLVVFVLVFIIVIRPQYGARHKIERELSESRQDYESALLATQDDTKARLNSEIETLQRKLDGFVLDFKSAADLTFDISRIAGESKLTSFNIQSDDMRASSVSADPNNIFEKHVNVSFISGFQEFAVFLNSLERHQPVLFIDSFTLSRQNNSKTGYQVSIGIAALVQKQQTAKADDEHPERIVGAEF